MTLRTKLSIISATILLATAVSSPAATIVYDNLGTAAQGGYSEPNANNPIFGDALNLTQAGTLTTFGTTVFNSSSGGNTGTMLTGTMVVKFYDNTIPYTSGVINKPLLGTANINWDFTSGGGLPAGFYTTGTSDLSGLNIALTQKVLVTQQFTQTTGNSTRNGVVLLSAPVVGSSPANVYMKSSATAEGLYTFAGTSNQFGFQIQVTGGGGGNNRPVADAQTVSCLKNATANVTLTGSDVDNNPLTFVVVNPPTNGNLTGSAPDLVYHPNADFVGSDAFTYVANDGQTDSVPALVSISVENSAGLIIVPDFDSSITSDPNAATIMNTINTAIAIYESKYADPVTVHIKFVKVATGLGASSTFIGTIPYANLVSALTADSKTTNDVTALAHIPGGANNPMDGGANIRLTTAEFRALGFSADPPAGQPDSTISLNISLCNLTRPPGNASKFDLRAVAMHEIDEVLGTSSGLPSGATPAVADLFRYSSTAGVRNYTTAGDDAFFSIDGTTRLVQYNQVAGADSGDWRSPNGHLPVRVQDAFGTPNTAPDLNVEIALLDVIGWDLVTTVAAPAPQITSITRSGGTVNFSWASVATRQYQVQYKTNVTSLIWNNLGSPITAVAATTSSSDSITPDKLRFYRIALLPGSVPPPPAGSLAPVNISPLTLETRYFLPSPQGGDNLASPVSVSAPQPLPEIQQGAKPN